MLLIFLWEYNIIISITIVYNAISVKARSWDAINIITTNKIIM